MLKLIKPKKQKTANRNSGFVRRIMEKTADSISYVTGEEELVFVQLSGFTKDSTMEQVMELLRLAARLLASGLGNAVFQKETYILNEVRILLESRRTSLNQDVLYPRFLEIYNGMAEYVNQNQREDSYLEELEEKLFLCGDILDRRKQKNIQNHITQTGIFKQNLQRNGDTLRISAMNQTVFGMIRRNHPYAKLIAENISYMQMLEKQIGKNQESFRLRYETERFLDALNQRQTEYLLWFIKEQHLFPMEYMQNISEENLDIRAIFQKTSEKDIRKFFLKLKSEAERQKNESIELKRTEKAKKAEKKRTQQKKLQEWQEHTRETFTLTAGELLASLEEKSLLEFFVEAEKKNQVISGQEAVKLQPMLQQLVQKMEQLEKQQPDMQKLLQEMNPDTLTAYGDFVMNYIQNHEEETDFSEETLQLAEKLEQIFYGENFSQSGITHIREIFQNYNLSVHSEELGEVANAFFSTGKTEEIKNAVQIMNQYNLEEIAAFFNLFAAEHEELEEILQTYRSEKIQMESAQKKQIEILKNENLESAAEAVAEKLIQMLERSAQEETESEKIREELEIQKIVRKEKYKAEKIQEENLKETFRQEIEKLLKEDNFIHEFSQKLESEDNGLMQLLEQKIIEDIQQKDVQSESQTETLQRIKQEMKAESFAENLIRILENNQKTIKTYSEIEKESEIAINNFLMESPQLQFLTAYAEQENRIEELQNIMESIQQKVKIFESTDITDLEKTKENSSYEESVREERLKEEKYQEESLKETFKQEIKKLLETDTFIREFSQKLESEDTDLIQLLEQSNIEFIENKHQKNVQPESIEKTLQTFKQEMQAESFTETLMQILENIYTDNIKKNWTGQETEVQTKYESEYDLKQELDFETGESEVEIAINNFLVESPQLQFLTAYAEEENRIEELQNIVELIQEKVKTYVDEKNKISQSTILSRFESAAITDLQKAKEHSSYEESVREERLKEEKYQEERLKETFKQEIKNLLETDSFLHDFSQKLEKKDTDLVQLLEQSNIDFIANKQNSMNNQMDVQTENLKTTLQTIKQEMQAESFAENLMQILEKIYTDSNEKHWTGQDSEVQTKYESEYDLKQELDFETGESEVDIAINNFLVESPQLQFLTAYAEEENRIEELQNIVELIQEKVKTYVDEKNEIRQSTISSRFESTDITDLEKTKENSSYEERVREERLKEEKYQEERLKETFKQKIKNLLETDTFLHEFSQKLEKEDTDLVQLLEQSNIDFIANRQNSMNNQMDVQTENLEKTLQTIQQEIQAESFAENLMQILENIYTESNEKNFLMENPQLQFLTAYAELENQNEELKLILEEIQKKVKTYLDERNEIRQSTISSRFESAAITDLEKTKENSSYEESVREERLKEEKYQEESLKETFKQEIKNLLETTFLYEFSQKLENEDADLIQLLTQSNIEFIENKQNGEILRQKSSFIIQQEDVEQQNSLHNQINVQPESVEKILQTIKQEMQAESFTENLMQILEKIYTDSKEKHRTGQDSEVQTKYESEYDLKQELDFETGESEVEIAMNNFLMESPQLQFLTAYAEQENQSEELQNIVEIIQKKVKTYVDERKEILQSTISSRLESTDITDFEKTIEHSNYEESVREERLKEEKYQEESLKETFKQEIKNLLETDTFVREFSQKLESEDTDLIQLLEQSNIEFIENKKNDEILQKKSSFNIQQEDVEQQNSLHNQVDVQPESIEKILQTIKQEMQAESFTETLMQILENIYTESSEKHQTEVDFLMESPQLQFLTAYAEQENRSEELQLIVEEIQKKAKTYVDERKEILQSTISSRFESADITDLEKTKENLKETFKQEIKNLLETDTFIYEFSQILESEDTDLIQLLEQKTMENLQQESSLTILQESPTEVFQTIWESLEKTIEKENMKQIFRELEDEIEVDTSSVEIYEHEGSEELQTILRIMQYQTDSDTILWENRQNATSLVSAKQIQTWMQREEMGTPLQYVAEYFDNRMTDSEIHYALQAASQNGEEKEKIEESLGNVKRQMEQVAQEVGRLKNTQNTMKEEFFRKSDIRMYQEDFLNHLEEEISSAGKRKGVY